MSNDTSNRPRGDLAGRLFPDGVEIAIACDLETLRPLSDTEEALIADAFPKRQVEFRLGRDCAHRALEKVGYPAASLPRRDDRAPAWPSGIAGALSHSSGMAIAAVSADQRYAGVGIDVERPQEAFGREVWKLCFSPDELAMLEKLPLDTGERKAHLWFSMKEAAFKALRNAGAGCEALAHVVLDFEDGEPVGAHETTTGKHCFVRGVSGPAFVVTGAWVEHETPRTRENAA